MQIALEAGSRFKAAPNELTPIPPVACVPYTLPPSEIIWSVLGTAESPFVADPAPSLILERGYSSDEDLRKATWPLDCLLDEVASQEGSRGAHKRRTKARKEPFQPMGFGILKSVWECRTESFSTIDL